jgi:tRNA-splicing ligase RtcB
LAYFPKETKEYDGYLEGLGIGQEFARLNRKIMYLLVLSAIQNVLDPKAKVDFEEWFPHDKTWIDEGLFIDCHHNYAEMESHSGRNYLVTRKGAIRARVNDMGIIPGSMGKKSFIIRGKGSEDSFTSASHGAGRKMSRTKARKEISVEQHKNDTQGVFCNKTADVIDESPGAYKDIDDVIRSEEDLVQVCHTLKQIICVKGI